MDKRAVPYQRMVFICTNVRQDNERPSCGQRGAEAICSALKDEVKKRGLKGKVRALKSGCMDLCEIGPNVMVFPDQTLHTGVTPADVPVLIEKYLAPSSA